MEIKLLFKALKFACLPTLSVLVLLICGFFSITKAIAWISSEDGAAIFIRVALVVAEIALIGYMYNQYLIEFNKEKAKNAKIALRNSIAETTKDSLTNLLSRDFSYNYEFRDYFKDTESSDQYRVYNTGDDTIKIVEQIKRK